MRKVVLCLLIFLFSIGTVSAFSLSGGGDWKYYREITIKENSGKTLTLFLHYHKFMGAKATIVSEQR